MSGVKGHKDMLSSIEIREFIETYTRGDNWQETNIDTGDLGYGWVHYALIRALKPQRVLSIGSRYGFVPAICALACKHNRKGRVDFVDAGYNYKNPKHKNHWGGVGFWRGTDPKKHFDKFKLGGNINTFVMTSSDFNKKYPSRKWAYINIDGDHSYKGIKYDFETFWPRLTKNGFVSLHDIYTKDTREIKYGVRKYWEELKGKYSNNFELEGDFGLGIIQK